MGIASPFLRSLPLEDHGLEWIHPELPVAHPFDDEPAAFVARDIEDTAEADEDEGLIVMSSAWCATGGHRANWLSLLPMTVLAMRRR